MVLGRLNFVPNDSQFVVAKELDFSPLELKVKQLEERQKYLMIALAILALYVILKK